MGPTVLGRNGAYFAKVFPPGSISLLMTLADVGFMIHVFTLGIQVNIDMLTKTGKSAAFIGSMCFLLPYALGFLTFSMLNSFGNLDASLKQSMPFIIIVNSLSTFPVITSLLADLRILNSEVGRMATHVSLVSDTWSWSMSMVVRTVNLAFETSKMESLWSVVSTMAFLVVIVFIIRPFLRWSSDSAKVGLSICVHLSDH